MGFFLEGETSFEGLGGARGGVIGREIGGALHGERCLVGVGELETLISLMNGEGNRRRTR